MNNPNEHRHCRIGRITLRGGAVLHLLPEDTARHDALIDELQKVTEYISEEYGTRFAGFALVAWNADGGHVALIQTFHGCPVCATDVPDAAKAALHRHLWLSDIRERT